MYDIEKSQKPNKLKNLKKYLIKLIKSQIICTSQISFLEYNKFHSKHFCIKSIGNELFQMVLIHSLC